MTKGPTLARSTRGSAFALPLLATLFAGGCAGAWKHYETRHVNLYTDASTGLDDITRTLEYQHAIMASSFFGGVAQSKVDVLVLDDVPFKTHFGSLRSAMMLSTSPGGHDIGKNGLIVLKWGESPISAATMMNHWFLDKAVPRAPLWFHCGFSQYAAGAHYVEKGNGAIACLGASWSYEDRVLMSVNDFGAASWSQYNDEHRAWLPFSGAVFVDWVVRGDGGAHRGALADIINHLASGVPTTEVLAKATPLTAAELDAALQRYRQTWVKAGCPFAFPIKPEALPDTDSPRPRDIAPERVNALLVALDTLPEVDGYAEYYPAAVVAQAGQGKKPRRR